MTQYTTFDALIAQYDAFLLDVWGVVHDGVALYPGVMPALEAMRAADKQVVFLSNAPRRAVKVERVLAAFGIGRELYHGIMSSGEFGFQLLQSGALDLGARYFFIGPERDQDVLQGLGFEEAPIDEADFILNVGYGSEEESDEDIAPVLAAAQAEGLPMLCLNPDLEVVRMSGERYPCAGVIAEAYRALGGVVHWCGKPYPEIYAHALNTFLPGIARERVLAVGDGLGTDILGANNAGIACAFSTSGILSAQLADVTEPTVRAFLEAQAIQPTYVIPNL